VAVVGGGWRKSRFFSVFAIVKTCGTHLRHFCRYLFPRVTVYRKYPLVIRTEIPVYISAEELELICLMGMFVKLFSGATRKIFVTRVKRSGKKISRSCNSK
jgi:hypothetical protein